MNKLGCASCRWIRHSGTTLASIWYRYTEQSSVVWSSSITKGESLELERIQKVALRIILKEDYVSYQNALKVTNLQSLEERRSMLLRKFALKSGKHPRTTDMFPVKKHSRILRRQEVYEVTRARTDRLAHSAITTMQRILNSEKRKN